MDFSVISGDVVSSTSLTVDEREQLVASLEGLLLQLDKTFEVYGRVVKGDYLECVVPNPADALRIALIIKSFVKKNAAEANGIPTEAYRIRYYKTYGIRLAVALGSLMTFDRKKDIIDGEAIYLSGREISSETTYNKERLVIKNSLFFVTNNDELNAIFRPIFALLDMLTAKATARQCEVLYLKLMNLSEGEIAQKLKIGQSAVNQHSTSLGWNAIESAVHFFENRISKR